MRKRTKYILKSLICASKIFITGAYFYDHKSKLSRVYRYNRMRELVTVQNRLCNMDFHVTGVENIPLEQSSLVVVNHQSFFDNFALLRIFKDPIAFVAKKELRDIPFVGKTVGQFDSVFINRDDLRSEIKTMKYVKESLLKDNIRWVIFPEGTRSKDKDFKVGEFKPGAFKYPMQIGKKIIPVALFGTRNIFDDNYKFLKRHDIYVHVFKPFEYKDYKDMSTQELSSLIEGMIKEKVQEFYLDFKKRNNIE